MKNRYSSTFFIFLSSMCFEFCNNIQGAKAEEFNTNLQKEYFSLNHNPKNYFNEKDQDLIKKSFYEKWIYFRGKFKIKTKFFDLFGISFKNKNSIFGFLSKELNLMHLVSGILTKIF